MNRSASDIFRLEHEVITKCGISKERFRKVSGSQWENIYQKIAEKYADKTKIWKNGLHWANTNGYSPKSMKELLGCYAVDYSTWFYFLPQMIKEENKMVYFLIDRRSDWYFGEETDFSQPTFLVGDNGELVSITELSYEGQSVYYCWWD